MDQNIDMVDRISHLPVPIMHHILSFLPVKQVVKTQALSKTWNHVWNTFPILEFNKAFSDETMGEHRPGYYKKARKWHQILRKGEELLNFVEQTLLSRCRQMLTINKFTLYMPVCDSNWVPLIDRCIGYAIERNVKELDIDIRMIAHIQYKLPESVFDHFGAELPNVRYSSLKRLFLSMVCVDDHTVQNLPNSFPEIEDLSFSSCDGLKSLQLSGFLQLQNVSVIKCFDLERVDIEAPNLQYFKYHYDNMRVAGEINIASCKNLKTLILNGASMTEKSFQDHISCFPLLENLELRWCNKLEHIKISSCCLKKLILAECRKLVEAKIDTPYLCSFRYRGNIISLSMNSLALSRAELSMHPDTIPKVIATFWYVKLMEFLGELNGAKELILSCSSKAIIIPKELRQSLIPPPCTANHLTFLISEGISHVESVDGVLWMFSHLDGITMESRCHNISIKFVYEKQLDREENLCWLHCLKEAKIVYEPSQYFSEKAKIKGLEAIWNLKKFFFENAKNLEKVDVIA